MMNNFDAAHKLLNIGQPMVREMYPTYRSKLDLFFIDHDFVPLLVQESYLTSFGTDRDSMEDLQKMADAAELISVGDLINTQIRKEQNWSLLPDYGSMSSVAPCLCTEGRVTFPAFPQYLGKYSKLRKAKRLIRELSQTIPCSIGRSGILLELVPFLLKNILDWLSRGYIEDVIDFLDDVKITNEMLKEHLISLSMDDKLTQKFEKMDPQLKVALTRQYNKDHKEISRIPQKGAAKKITDKELAQAEGNSEREAGSDSESDHAQGQLLDEIQIEEIKRAKKQEKELTRQQNTLKRIGKIADFHLVNVVPVDEDPKSAGKGRGQKKGAGAGRGRGRGRK